MEDLTNATRPAPRLQEAPPPRLTVLQAVWRNAPLVLAPVVVLLLIATAIGFARTPVYTSQAELNVGGLDLTQQSIQGYTAAVQSLAVSYAEAIQATDVVNPVARQLHVSPAYVRQHTSATPIPNTSVIIVSGATHQQGQSVALADALSNSLVNYAMQLNAGSFNTNNLLGQYKAQSKKLQQASTALAKMSPDDPRRQAAQTRKDVDQLQFNTLAALYSQSQAGLATTNLAQKLAPAAPPTSDRASVLEDLLIGALIAGLLIGVGLAVARANSVTTRRLRAL